MAKLRFPKNRKQWLDFGGTLLVNPYFWAVAIRLLMMVLIPRSLQGDAADYEIMANNLAAGRGLSRCYAEPFAPTFQRPPLYSMILAVFYLMGVSHDTGPIFINLLCDLISMKLAQTWGEDLRFTWARKIPWVVALCPLLITFGMYPTTENLSITLFFAAVVLTFRKMPSGAGLFWGLLALCRSYFLLFPFALWIFRPSRKWSRKGLTILVAMSMVVPCLWMGRNYRLLHKFAFSQSGMVGWQMYQGLCIPAFDWWRPDHQEEISSHEVMRKMMASHCSQEDEIFKLDRGAVELVKQCVTEHPFQATRNFVIKELNLFTNWGIVMPYNRTIFVAMSAINGILFLYWWCVICVLRSRRKSSPGRGGGARATGIEDALRFSLLGIAYVVAVTLPFALDARYLLAPFLTLIIVIFEIVRTPNALIQAGLKGKP